MPPSIRAHLAALAVALTAVSSAFAQTSTADLDRDLGALHAQSHIPGLCVSVFNADGVLYEKGFGYADLATKRPYTPQTAQPIGSISKTLIGAALMTGVERGWFTLDQDVNDILPFAVRNPNFPDKPITLRQLATHTSGLVDREAVYAKAYVKGDDNALRIDDFLKAYVTPGGKTYDKRNFANTAPGAAYAYSNIGATLAAYAVEVKAGESYAAFTRKTFLEPLGMSRSGWTDQTSGPERATLYDEKLRPLPAYALTTYPDGGLRTTCDDLAKFIGAILKARAGGAGPLSQTSVETMLKPEFTPEHTPANLSPKEPNQGIFWQYRREGTVGHFGGDPGVTTFMGVDPSSGVGKIMLTNVGGEAAVKAYGAELGALWKALLAYQPSPPSR